MSSPHDNDDTKLPRRAKEIFDAGVVSLDVATRGKLARARARALDTAARPSWFAQLLGARPWMAAGGALAAATLIAVALWQGPGVPEAPVAVAALDDLELLLAEDEFEMLEELEFYAWLEEQPELAMPPADDGVG